MRRIIPRYHSTYGKNRIFIRFNAAATSCFSQEAHGAKFGRWETRCLAPTDSSLHALVPAY